MVGNVQKGTKPGGSPLPPTPSQQLQSPLCHPAVRIQCDVPCLVGFKPGKGCVIIKSEGFLQLLGAWRLLFLRRTVGCVARACHGLGSLHVEKAYASNMQRALKMGPGQQRGAVTPAFAGDLSLSLPVASLHPLRAAAGSLQPTFPSIVPRFLYCPLVWDLPTHCSFSAPQALCPVVPDPSSPMPGRIRLP